MFHKMEQKIELCDVILLHWNPDTLKKSTAVEDLKAKIARIDSMRSLCPVGLERIRLFPFVLDVTTACDVYIYWTRLQFSSVGKSAACNDEKRKCPIC